ncbi:hypothetical protein ACRQ5D_32705 [Mucilaginibacter sp. P25]|uniref:Uncharacterized protein n=1 Tax=Mucilaginibacter gossypii TaxID=551996 RepID=A0A1G8BQU4_9SPHI|nr:MULTISPECIES: hypothetical protein [Mucilaginibacter]QTE39785.1 hypothetical protein J3L18_12265 [Mucilaginibacter gossypii]SDH35511.1 hypothetical protein SAMN05192573_10935 [Mucilaginibacter gossypii]
MQNIAKAGKGYTLPFARRAAAFTLQFMEDAFHPHQLYKLFYADNQPAEFLTFNNLST